MQIKIGFIICEFALLLSMDAVGQPLTLENLIQKGLANNVGLQAGIVENELISSDTLVPSIEKNPELNLDAGYNINDPSKPRAGIRISQEIQPRFQQKKYRLAKANLASTVQLQKSQQLDLETEIRIAFYKWQIVNQKIKIQVEVANRWEAFAKIVESKVKAGRLSEMDQLQAQLNAAHARQREMELTLELNSIGKELEFLTASNHPLDSLMPISLEPLPQIIELDSLTEWSISENPELKTLSLEVAAKKFQVELEISRKNPAFTFSFGVERETEGANILAGGLAIPISIFNRNQSAVTKSQVELRLAEIHLRSTQAKIKNEIQKSRGKILALQQRYLQQQKFIQPLSRKQLALSQKGFAQGILGIFEMSRVEEEFQMQEMEALTILDEYYEQWNQLGKMVGGKIWKF